MVIQHNTTIVLWGWADVNDKITIKTSWLKQAMRIEADHQSTWSIALKTTNGKDPQSITIKSRNI